MDRDAMTRLAEAGLPVRAVRHHRRDDESRIVAWSSPPDDAQRERAERILAGYSVHHVC